MNFIKMEGTGNSYIYIDYMNKKLNNIDYSELSKKISDYNYGIGSDGLIVICKSNLADAKMLIYNKDGSEALMCGNGIRCVAKYLFDKYFDKNELLIETKSGIKKVFKENDKIKVNMGKVKIIKKENNLYYVDIGNYHIVLFENNIDKLNLEEFVKKLNKDDYNIEVVEVINRNKIKVRVYERGSMETLSCGTGACASAYTCFVNNLVESNVEVLLRGGTLYIEINDNVYLSGDVNLVCKGKYLYKK